LFCFEYYLIDIIFKASLQEAIEEKSLNWSGKTRSKSNSMSSVDSKEGLNESIGSSLLESSPVKKI